MAKFANFYRDACMHFLHSNNQQQHAGESPLGGHGMCFRSRHTSTVSTNVLDFSSVYIFGYCGAVQVEMAKLDDTMDDTIKEYDVDDAHTDASAIRACAWDAGQRLECPWGREAACYVSYWWAAGARATPVGTEAMRLSHGWAGASHPRVIMFISPIGAQASPRSWSRRRARRRRALAA